MGLNKAANRPKREDAGPDAAGMAGVSSREAANWQALEDTGQYPEAVATKSPLAAVFYPNLPRGQ